MDKLFQTKPFTKRELRKVKRLQKMYCGAISSIEKNDCVNFSYVLSVGAKDMQDIHQCAISFTFSHHIDVSLAYPYFIGRSFNGLSFSQKLKAVMMFARGVFTKQK